MGGRREVSVIFYRPVTRSDLKQERSFFRGSVSSYLQLVVACSRGTCVGEGGGGCGREILPFNSCMSPDFLLVPDHQIE